MKNSHKALNIVIALGGVCLIAAGLLAITKNAVTSVSIIVIGLALLVALASLNLGKKIRK